MYIYIHVAYAIKISVKKSVSLNMWISSPMIFLIV